MLLIATEEPNLSPAAASEAVSFEAWPQFAVPPWLDVKI
jgi:hypothetical protein